MEVKDDRLKRFLAGYILPFDGFIEDSEAYPAQSKKKWPHITPFKVVWVKDLKAFWFLSGGLTTLVNYPADQRPSFVVKSIDHLGDEFGDGPCPYPTEELTPTDETIDSGLMANAPLDIWCEVLPDKVVNRTTGAEVDFSTLGLHCYGTWEDSRMNGSSTSRWLNVIFTDRIITYEKFERQVDWKTWYFGNFKHNSDLYDVPVGATVTILNYIGKTEEVLHEFWDAGDAYKTPEILNKETPLLCKEDGYIYRINYETEDIERVRPFMIGSKNMEAINPGYEYGVKLQERFNKLTDVTSFDGRGIAANIDYRLATEMPEKMPALDLSKCTTVKNYPPSFTYSGLGYNRVKEIQQVDLRNAGTLSRFGSCECTSLPRLHLPNLKNGNEAFATNSSLTTLSVLGDEYITGKDECYLPTLSYAVSMFEGCFSLVAAPYLNTPALTNMNKMFNRCFSLVAAPWIITDNVTNMSYAFVNCLSMASCPAYTTTKCTNFSCMFYNCKSLRHLPNLNFANGTTLKSICTNCVSLESAGDINAPKCTDFAQLFQSCSSLRRIESIQLDAATTTTNMFHLCPKIDYLVIKSFPKAAMTLYFDGLVSWGTTDSGKWSMIESSKALTARTATTTCTLRLPTATYNRWKEYVPTLDTMLTNAHITLVKI